MAVKISAVKMDDRETILQDLIRLGQRGGFFTERLSEDMLNADLKAQTQQVVERIGEELTDRIHNPKNYMIALTSFSMYMGMCALSLWQEDPKQIGKDGAADSVLYRCDILSLPEYASDLTGIDADPDYAVKFRDFMGLFQTRALMLSCNKDLEKLNRETGREAAAAMYMLGVLTQQDRLDKETKA